MGDNKWVWLDASIIDAVSKPDTFDSSEEESIGESGIDISTGELGIDME